MIIPFVVQANKIPIYEKLKLDRVI